MNLLSYYNSLEGGEGIIPAFDKWYLGISPMERSGWIFVVLVIVLICFGGKKGG